MDSAGIIIVAVVFFVGLGLAGAIIQQHRQLQRMLRTGDIRGLIKAGWRVESEVGDHVVVVKGHRVNHLLHFFVSLVTLGLWLLPWALISIRGGERRKTAIKSK